MAANKTQDDAREGVPQDRERMCLDAKSLDWPRCCPKRPTHVQCAQMVSAAEPVSKLQRTTADGWGGIGKGVSSRGLAIFLVPQNSGAESQFRFMSRAWPLGQSRDPRQRGLVLGSRDQAVLSERRSGRVFCRGGKAKDGRSSVECRAASRVCCSGRSAPETSGSSWLPGAASKAGRRSAVIEGIGGPE